MMKIAEASLVSNISAGFTLPSYRAMTKPIFFESRRSSRVPLKVVISVEDDPSQTCGGETETSVFMAL
jgi:hypothetical protein